MACPYCGSQTAISTKQSAKHDFADYAAVARVPPTELPAVAVRCGNCGATQSTTAVSCRCTSCGGGLVVTEDFDGQLKLPDGIVPFMVDKERANKEFTTWSSSRWFAPNALKAVVKTDSMTGSYLPHWGFDDLTTTQYRGERGDHYWDTETYTTLENGESVTQTRQVQKTRWFPTSGRVSRTFVDVVTAAVTTPDPDTLDKLGPWSTAGATSYESEFLAGFDTPRYTVPAESGFRTAKERMAKRIEEDCRKDIGGDEQRISKMRTTDADVLFRLLLMPLWIATYIVAGSTYHVFVNANTGEVIGERPYSIVKITLAVLSALIVIGAAIAVYKTTRT